MVAGVYCNRLYALHADNGEVRSLSFAANNRL